MCKLKRFKKKDDNFGSRKNSAHLKRNEQFFKSSEPTLKIYVKHKQYVNKKEYGGNRRKWDRR